MNLETRFHGVSFNPSDRTVREFSRADFDRELADPAVFSWVDIEGPEIAPMNEVMRQMGIDLVLVSHFDEPEVLPRVVERPDCIAFYLYPIYEPERHLDVSVTPDDLDFARLIMVVGADFVVTYHQRRLDVVEEVKTSCVDSFRLAGRTPGFLAFLFLQRLLYDYAHLNLANDNFLDQLQPDHADERRDQVIAVTGHNILTLKKLVASLHIVLMLLGTKRNRFISDEARGSFHDMLANALAVRAAIDSSRDMLDGVQRDIQTAAADRTNEIVRVLTLVSSIMLPLTFIAGIYGMNFENIPELKLPYGYYGALALMATIAGGLLLLFRRLGWLGGGKPRRRAGG